MKHLIFLAFGAVFLSACAGNSVKEEGADSNAGDSASSPIVANPKHPLHIVASDRCIQEEDNKEFESFGSIVAATLVQHAITSGFSALKSYATEKATADTKARTFSSIKPVYLYQSKFSLAAPDKPIVYDRSKSLSCLTFYVPGSSEKAGYEEWVDALYSKLTEQCDDCKKKLENYLEKDLGLSRKPKAMYQLELVTTGDKRYVIYKPNFLYYGERLGVSKSSNDMDLSMIVELLNPADRKVWHQFSVDFKDVKPNTYYLSKELAASTQVAMSAIAPEKALSDLVVSAKTINDTYSKTTEDLVVEKEKFKKFCEGEDIDEKACKALSKKIVTLEISQARQKILKMGFVNKMKSYAGEDTGTIPSNMANIKASISEVGDVSKFWKVIADGLGAVEQPVKDYAQERYNVISGNTEESDISSMKTKLDYEIALVGLRKAIQDLDEADDGTLEHFDKQKSCLEALKVASEASINAGSAIPADIDISCQ